MSGRILTGLLALGLFCSCARAEIAVSYLPQAPVIDGRLDASLQGLEKHDFPVRAASSKMPAGFAPSYRIGYGASYLYLYIEVPQAALATRDRAYQNGDGYILALAQPRADGTPSEEFSVFGFTASGKPQSAWQKQFRWYHNKALTFDDLPDAQTATFSENGRTGIELRLPWSAVTPLHPWLGPVGFNLSYIRADGETEHSDFMVVDDPRIQSEQSPRRTVMLKFVPPSSGPQQVIASIRDGHVPEGGALQVRIATYAPAAQDLHGAITIASGEREMLHQQPVDLALPRGLSVHTVDVPLDMLTPGGYGLDWNGDLAGQPQAGLSVLPQFDAAAAKARLDKLRGRIAAGSFSTLAFRLDEIASKTTALYPYETAGALREEITTTAAVLAEAERGNDVLAAKTGLVRRAFHSAVDGTLQPYTVRVPEKIIPGRKYPLIVFLHGSGEDDQGTIRPAMFPADAFVVAPFGRGTSNAYTSDHAQDDVREAVQDAVANYPIDPARVIMSGFSMGGYGAYRTFDADRGRYRAVAIFSGHPSLGRMWIGDEAPDYLHGSSLTAFRGAEVFIFHGGKDRNCPIELTREMVDKLKAAGAKVTFEYVPDQGHNLPPEPSIASFQSWLKRVLK